jgi:hypothetical protein
MGLNGMEIEVRGARIARPEGLSPAPLRVSRNGTPNVADRLSALLLPKLQSLFHSFAGGRSMFSTEQDYFKGGSPSPPGDGRGEGVSSLNVMLLIGFPRAAPEAAMDRAVGTEALLPPACRLACSFPNILRHLINRIDPDKIVLATFHDWIN